MKSALRAARSSLPMKSGLIQKTIRAMPLSAAAASGRAMLTKADMKCATAVPVQGMTRSFDVST